MTKPVVFRTEHEPSWSHVDPYFHVNSEFYLHYYIEHRFQGLRKELGLNLAEFQKLPFGIFLTSMTINFLKPLKAEQTFLIESFVESFDESTCLVKCEMTDKNGKKISACQMTYACVDLKAGRPMPWPQEFVQRFYR